MKTKQCGAERRQALHAALTPQYREGGVVTDSPAQGFPGGQLVAVVRQYCGGAGNGEQPKLLLLPPGGRVNLS